MKKHFSIDVSYTQICIFDAKIKAPFSIWEPSHVRQGFAWREGSVSFGTLEDGEHEISLILLDNFNDISQDAQRVIDVPFKIPHSGDIEVGSISDGKIVNFPEGQYLLRMELIKTTTHSAAPKINFYFAPNKAPNFEIVLGDTEVPLTKDLLLEAKAAT